MQVEAHGVLYGEDGYYTAMTPILEGRGLASEGLKTAPAAMGVNMLRDSAVRSGGCAQHRQDV
ncbi:hypothetical protein GCM10010872_10070 [Dyella flava]|nr:hypothetical protein GCM10010872_10070 [Dyella flava]